MSVESGLYSYLTAQSAVTSLVSTRIYPLAAPQDAAMPFVVYQRISDRHEHHMGGASGVATATIQLDAYASTYLSAKAIAEALRGELQGYRGTMGSYAVRRCHLDGTQDDYEPSETAGDKGTWRVSSDYQIAYHESIPTY